MKEQSLVRQHMSTVLLVLSAAFIVGSFGNVREYIALSHPGWTSWVLGGAISAVVFFSSYLAATAKRWSTRIAAIVIGVVFGVTSGYFQFSLYRLGEADVPTAFLLSFIPLVIGEVGLALLDSFFSSEKSEEHPTIDPAQLDELRQALTQSDADLTALRQAYDGIRQQLETSRQQFDEVSSTLEEQQTLSQSAQTELSSAQTEIKRLRKELESFEPSAVLNLLSDEQRQKAQALLQLIADNKVEKATDLLKLEASRADVYALWPVLVSAVLIYPNGDDSYHVRGGAL